MAMWFEHESDKIKLRKLLSPYDNLVLGPNPLDGMAKETAMQFDIFINLSENVLYSKNSKKPKQSTIYHWIPIEELEPWGYAPFIKTKIILDYALSKQIAVYMHCHAGTNRAPCIAMAWLMSNSHSLDESAYIVAQEKSSSFVKKYQLNIDQGYIPKDLDKLNTSCNALKDSLTKTGTTLEQAILAEYSCLLQKPLI